MNGLGYSTLQRSYSSPFAERDSEFEALLARLDTETGAGRPAVDRTGRGFIAWVQQALNRAMGLRLAVDGLMGPQTRAAVRSFQQRQGLTPDGIVGPATEERLRRLTGSSPQPGTAATCPPTPTFVDCPPPGKPVETLDEFDFNGSRLKPHHGPRLDNIAKQVVDSQVTSSPIRTILIAGHTDTVGDENYNFDLGWKRATAVMVELCKLLSGKVPGTLTIQLTSCGERQPKATDGASRRVEVFFPGRGSSPFDPGLQPCLDECERQFQRCRGTAPLIECARKRRSCQKDCEGRPA